MTLPFSQIAMIDPIGRGEDPQVLTTVTSLAALLFNRQSSSSRNTVISIFSIDPSYFYSIKAVMIF